VWLKGSTVGEREHGTRVGAGSAAWTVRTLDIVDWGRLGLPSSHDEGVQLREVRGHVTARSRVSTQSLPHGSLNHRVALGELSNQIESAAGEITGLPTSWIDSRGHGGTDFGEQCRPFPLDLANGAASEW